MFDRFTRDARRVVVRAADQEARAAGSPTIEAAHLLLALAAEAETPVGELLAGEGLDSDGLREALELEQERSLAAVGVALADHPAARGRAAPRRRPRFAASAKRALHAAVRTAVARGDRDLTAPHLLVGILRADIGTVPRALAAAGVDRIALASRAERLLG